VSKVNVRLILLVLIVAAPLIAFYFWLRSRPIDRPLIDIPPVNTKGFVAALREDDSGNSRLVAIGVDGTIRELEGSAGADDGEPTWNRAGTRIVFISNRAPDGSYQLFDWRPDRGTDDPFQLTPGGASRSNPWTSPGSDTIYYASRGEIVRMDFPNFEATRTVYPPADAPNTQRGEEGDENTGHDDHATTDRMLQAWKALSGALEGESFERGYVDASGRYFAGVYATGRGQVLVLQDLEPMTDEANAPAAPIAGDSIEIAMHPTDPIALVTVRNFRFPLPGQLPKELIDAQGNVKRQFVNGAYLLRLDGSAPPTLIFQSADGSQAIVLPAFSPDGSEIAFIPLTLSDGAAKPAGVVIGPADGSRAGTLVISGDIPEFSWSPDGKALAFSRGGDIFTIERTGSGEKNLTQGKGRFSNPRYSPMK
jgi:hypothetical protein